MTEATTRPQRPTSRPKPAKATRYVAAGAAVGATIALAGGMAAASSASADSPPPAVRQVVVESPSPTASTPIVIVLPSNDPNFQIADILPDVVSAIEVPATPEPARAAVATQTPTPTQPVTESGGS
jgi:hypothetical protein